MEIFDGQRFASTCARCLCLLPLLSLGACSQHEVDGLVEGILALFMVMMVVVVVGMIISTIYMVFSIVIVVMNFVRPNRFTMVAGFVIGGLDLLTLLGSVGFFVSIMVDQESFNSEGEILPMIIWTAISAIIGGVKVASGVYAKRKLYDAQPPEA